MSREKPYIYTLDFSHYEMKNSYIKTGKTANHYSRNHDYTDRYPESWMRLDFICISSDSDKYEKDVKHHFNLSGRSEYISYPNAVDLIEMQKHVIKFMLFHPNTEKIIFVKQEYMMFVSDLIEENPILSDKFKNWRNEYLGINEDCIKYYFKKGPYPYHYRSYWQAYEYINKYKDGDTEFAGNKTSNKNIDRKTYLKNIDIIKDPKMSKAFYKEWKQLDIWKKELFN